MKKGDSTMRILLARIRAITRNQPAADTKLRMGNISLDRSTFKLTGFPLTYRLLSAFAYRF